MFFQCMVTLNYCTLFISSDLIIFALNLRTDDLLLDFFFFFFLLVSARLNSFFL